MPGLRRQRCSTRRRYQRALEGGSGNSLGDWGPAVAAAAPRIWWRVRPAQPSAWLAHRTIVQVSEVQPSRQGTTKAALSRIGPGSG